MSHRSLPAPRRSPTLDRSLRGHGVGFEVQGRDAADGVPPSGERIGPAASTIRPRSPRLGPSLEPSAAPDHVASVALEGAADVLGIDLGAMGRPRGRSRRLEGGLRRRGRPESVDELDALGPRVTGQSPVVSPRSGRSRLEGDGPGRVDEPDPVVRRRDPLPGGDVPVRSRNTLRDRRRLRVIVPSGPARTVRRSPIGVRRPRAGRTGSTPGPPVPNVLSRRPVRSSADDSSYRDAKAK